MSDPNVEDLCDMLLRRSQFGIEIYGTTTERPDVDLKGWLHHALEEGLDKCVYLRAAIRRVEEQEQVIAQLQADLERARKDFLDLSTKEATLTDIAVRNGTLTAKVATETAGLIANHFSALLEHKGAKNYLEMHFSSRDGKEVLLTLQRADGKSPHQLRTEAEEEAAKLRGALTHVRDCLAKEDACCCHEGEKLIKVALDEIPKGERPRPHPRCAQCDEPVVCGRYRVTYCPLCEEDKPQGE